MKQNRLAFLIVCVVIFLAFAEAHAQSTVDGQPSVLKEDKGQSNYVYDLKLLIKKSKDNIKGVNEKIKEQAVIKRNQQREQKAREYYEQALKLQGEGRLEEARQLFDKAIRITEHPEMKYYIKESERRSKLQQAALQREETDQERRVNEDQKVLTERAETSYQTAVTLYKQQKFREAKDEFTVVEELCPDYKAVRSYLQIIEQDIVQSEHLNMKEQTKEIERQQKEEEIARLREKELWRKEVDKKEEERQLQLRKQAQGVYEEALKLFDERNYSAARDKFQEVEWVVPDYKATRAYLTRIENGLQDEKKQVTQERQRELEKQRWQEVLTEKKSAEERRKALEKREQDKLLQVKDQAEFVYVAAVALFEKDLLAQSKEKFNEVNTLYPNYKSTADYLKRIDQVASEKTERESLKKKSDDERRIWEEELERRKQDKEKFKLLAAEADIFYNDAMLLYQTGRLIEAKEKFLAVDQRVPDYKSTRSYLKRIDQDIELMVKTQKAQDSLAGQREELEKMRMMREKAEETYVQAVSAYDAKDFAAAKAGFQATDGIYPDYKKTKFYLNRIDEDIRSKAEEVARMAREREADMSYVQAVALYQAGQFEDARKKFLAVEGTIPGYKLTEDFLGRVDDDILKKKESDLVRMKEDRIKGLYDQATVLYQNGQLSDAKEKFLEVEVVYPGYKDSARILETIDVEIEKKKKEVAELKEKEMAEKFYSEALALYQSGEYAAAKEKFVKTEVVSSGYKDCLKYLGRIDGDIERKKKDEEIRLKTQEVDPIYVQAVGLYKDADFVEAKKKLIAVQAVFAGYKDTSLYLTRIDKDIRDQEDRLVKEEKMRKSDLIYSEAVKLYVERRFIEAREKFIALAGIDQGYKNLRNYLTRIDQDIRQEAQTKARLQAEEQVAEPYAQAVTLYHDGDFKAAKEKFMAVSQRVPDYKKNKYYLARIDDDIHAKKTAQDRELAEKTEAVYREAVVLMGNGKVLEAYAKFCDVQVMYPDYKAVAVNIDKLRKLGAEKGLNLPEAPEAVPVVAEDDTQAALLYKEAVRLYKDKKYDEAKVKFDSVARIKPGYRSTQQYFDSINEFKAAAIKKQNDVVKSQPKVVVQSEVPAKVEAKNDRVKIVEVPKVEVKASVSEDDAKALAKLSARSSAIYDQIKSLSEDKQLSDTSRTFAKVDRLIENLEAERRRVAEQVSREKKAEEAEILRGKRLEKEKMAADQRKALREASENKAEKEAQERQAKILKEREDLRKKERVELEALKDQAREAQLKAEVLYQQALGFYRDRNYDTAHDRLAEVEKIMPDYKDTVKLLTRVERAQDEVSLVAEENRDRVAIKSLAEKATALNVEILGLSQKKDYASIEQRFNDLESILKEIQVVKGRMVSRRDTFESRWEKKAGERKAEAKKLMPPKAVKEGEDFISLREKARTAFKEGQQLYASENFSDARVKFMDAIHYDASFKAPLSYLTRIDRILSNRDFEVHQEKQKAKERVIENKEKGSATAVAEGAKTAEALVDPQRAIQVSMDGVSLYQAKRYREARIKFEELLQIGTPAQQQSATRYLKLIEGALDKEKKTAENEKRAEQDRYLEERRAQAKLAWERDKKEQERERRKTQELAAVQRELDIRRQQELRAIEEQNLKQRREMLERKKIEMIKALHDDELEAEKFSGEARLEKTPLDVNGAQQGVVDQKDAAARVEQQRQPAAVDEAETDAREKVQASPGRVDESMLMDEHREKVKADAKIGQQRRRLEQLESKEQRERHISEDKERRRVEQAEVEKKKAADKLAKDKEIAEKAVFAARQNEEMRQKTSQQREQEELIRRNQQEVQAILKDVPVVAPVPMGPVPVQGPAVIPQSPVGIDNEDPAALLLKQAAEQEKQHLEDQRASIRKDFEDGVERFYNEAIGLFKKKMYDEAYQDFEQVDQLIKGYKKTAQYLKETERQLSRSGH